MKILQVHVPYREAGGEDAVVAAEAALLRDAGHTVVQHLVPNPTGTAMTAAALAVAPHNPIAAAGVRRLVAEHKPDVAHVHNTWFSLTPAVITALHRAGVPVVATLHNYRLLCANALLYRDGHPCTDCVGRAPWPGVVHRCYRSSAVASTAVAATIAMNRRRWVHDVDVFLALSGFARDLFVTGGLPADKIVVKSNAVPDPGPRGSPPSQSDTVLFVGRLAVEKGVATLLDAWRAWRGDRSMELHIVGEGPLAAQLRAQADDSVRFLGYCQPAEVMSAMHTARALVFPSVSYEGPALTMMEAFSAGLPVLASATAGNPEILQKPGQRGWLATPGEPSSWVAALDVLDDDAALDRAGRGARALYEERYAPQVALHSLKAAYDRARATALTRVGRR